MRIVSTVLALSILVTSSCDKTATIPDPPLPYDDQLAIDLQVIDDYLASNNITPIIDEESGLRYVVHTEGSGTITPTNKNCVKAEYIGLRLRDNYEFDKSGTSDATFSVLGVIQGWQVGLKQMQVGDSVTLYVPSGLAYGPYGSGSEIGANEIIYFGLELKAIGEYDFDPAAGFYKCYFDEL